jgi:hypothetical protein
MMGFAIPVSCPNEKGGHRWPLWSADGIISRLANLQHVTAFAANDVEIGH